MLVTESTLVGFTILNGTYSMQLALLAGSLYNLWKYPIIRNTPMQLTPSEQQLFYHSRYYYIPIAHLLLFASNLIQQYKPAKRKKVNQIFSFASTILMVLQNLLISRLMGYFPVGYEITDNEVLTAVYVWLQIEWVTFVAIIVSNVCFLLLRSCFHHKIRVEDVPERMQLPGIDTIVAIQSIANQFNSQYVPAIISFVIFYRTGQLRSFQ